MAGLRICALLTLAVLAAYHATRILAAQCSGPRCDVFIGNVLIFALAACLAALTGLLGIVAAARRQQGGWLGLLVGCTLLEILVPTVGLALFRNSPDTFVILSTTAVALVSLVTLIYSFVPPGLREQAPS